MNTRIDRVIMKDLISAMQPGTVTVICGPKRSGKTTLMKMAGDSLIESGVSPGNVHYHSPTANNKRQPDLFTFIEPHSPDRVSDEPVYLFIDEPSIVPEASPDKVIVISIAGTAENFKDKKEFNDHKIFMLWPLSFKEILNSCGLGEMAIDLGSALEAFMDWPDAGYYAVRETCQRIEEDSHSFELFKQVMHRYQSIGGYPELWRHFKLENIESDSENTIDASIAWEPSTILETQLSHAAELASVRSTAELRKLAVTVLSSDDAAVHPLVVARMAEVTFITAKKWIKGLVKAGLLIELEPRLGKPKGHVKMRLGFVADPGIRAGLGAPCSPTRKVEELMVQQLMKLSSFRTNVSTGIKYWCSNSGNRIPVIWKDGGTEIPFVTAFGGGAGRGLVQFLRSSGVREGVVISEDGKTDRKTIGSPANHGVTSIPEWMMTGI